jgi:hypothetical protein
MRPEMTHLVKRVVDIHPSMGKLETLVGEDGFGGMEDLGMVVGIDGDCCRKICHVSGGGCGRVLPRVDMKRGSRPLEFVWRNRSWWRTCFSCF